MSEVIAVCRLGCSNEYDRHVVVTIITNIVITITIIVIVAVAVAVANYV